MKGYKKNLFIVLLVILGVLTSAASAFGASKLKDDIKLTVKTDKDTYAKGEAVKLEISLENNSGSTIEDVTITPTIPKGLKVVGDIKALEFGEIKPGPEHKVLSTIALASAEEAEEKEVEKDSEPAEKKEEKKETLPATGESNKILYLGIASILLGLLILFGLKYGKKFNGILSVFIVVFLVIGLFPLAALADTGDGYETVEGSTTITVDGKEYTISAIASFKVAAEEEEDKEDTKEPEEYKVSFDSAGGSVINPIIQNYGTEITAPSNPIKEGYRFDGWDKEIPKIMPSEDLIITAKWVLVDYKIIYNLSDGTNDTNNPESYTIETETIILKEASKKGYTFIGWYDAEEEGNEVTEITKGSIGDIELYAKFEAEPMEISLYEIYPEEDENEDYYIIIINDEEFYDKYFDGGQFDFRSDDAKVKLIYNPDFEEFAGRTFILIGVRTIPGEDQNRIICQEYFLN